MSQFYQQFKHNSNYQTPDSALEISVIDMHTGGEPLRVITSGYPEIKADSLLDYRRKLKANFDHLRTAIMFEPRGHADMYGCLVLPPFNSDADCSVIFMHNEGYSTMCGHAVIGMMTLAVKMGWVELKDNHASMTIEAPCGLIKAWAKVEGEEVYATFDCVPSFVKEADVQVYIESLGQSIKYDLAYGGAFYAYVETEQFGLSLVPENYHQLISLGREIKEQVIASNQNIVHPVEEDLSFLYGTIFVGRPISEGVDSRNVCVFADGEIDRSPTGSGVSGRMAIHHSRGDLQIGEGMDIESLIGSSFRAEVASTAKLGDIEAVIPRVSGQAHICGVNRLILDPKDPLNNGFLLR